MVKKIAKDDSSRFLSGLKRDLEKVDSLKPVRKRSVKVISKSIRKPRKVEIRKQPKISKKVKEFKSEIKKPKAPKVAKKNKKTKYNLSSIKSSKKSSVKVISKSIRKQPKIEKVKESKIKVKEPKVSKKNLKRSNLKIRDLPVSDIKKKIKEFKSKIKKPKVKKAVKKTKKVKAETKQLPVLNLKTDSDIAMDFATKIYIKFNKLVKSVILFGSIAKKTNVPGSDLDIIIIIDDAAIRWDDELITWYREELEKIIHANDYRRDLHINTIKLTTWWEDLIRGDPVVINVIREGQSLIDFGGFFEPLKYLLVTGKIKSTPEAIYSLLQRAPQHIVRSKISELNAIEGLYWAMVDSAQAALIAMKVQPSSPENIAVELKRNFVNSGSLKMKYAVWIRDLLALHKKILHKEITDLKGIEIDEWQDRTEEFLEVMVKLVNDLIEKQS